MDKRIVYEMDNGVVAVLIPAPECLTKWTLEEIAAKDVPAGVPYKIVDATDIPTDRTFRDAWTVAIDTPDGVGGEHDEFPTQEPQ